MSSTTPVGELPPTSSQNGGDATCETPRRSAKRRKTNRQILVESNRISELGRKDLAGGKWLQFKQVSYTIEKEFEVSQVTDWEYVERTTRKGNLDGMDVIPIHIVSDDTAPNGKRKTLVLIANYRAPISAFCLEIPSGLVDEGEGEEEAALRELKEETGYTGNKVVSISGEVFCDPWKSNENSKIVVVEIDGDAEENKNPKQNLDDAESIIVKHVPFENLTKSLKDFQDEGYAVDSKVYTFACGLQMAASLL